MDQTKRGTITKANVTRMINRYQAGDSLEEIGAVFGIKGASVSYHLKRNGVSLRAKGPHHKTK